jgi:hypothetical protein
MIQNTRWASRYGGCVMTWVTKRWNGSIPVGLLATAEELRAMNIHRGQVRPGATSRVLVLDTSGLAWTGRQGGMLSNARLDAGLFVSREHELIVSQKAAFPVPRVQV